MRRIALFSLMFLFAADGAFAHTKDHPSIHDTVSGIMARLGAEVAADDLVNLRVEELLPHLTADEKRILGEELIRFTVDVPVTVSIIREQATGEEVFWLEGRGFTKTKATVVADGDNFEVWTKSFPAGGIGLGVTSLSGNGDHYFVGIAPKKKGAQIAVTDIYPGYHTLGTLAIGERPFLRWDDRVIDSLSPELKGQTLLRTDEDKRRSGKLTNVFNKTAYPAQIAPDQITLTWSDDPQTTQTLQWRTNTDATGGIVRYWKSDDASATVELRATTEELVNYNTVNDPIVHRHTVTMRNLQPGTHYMYKVESLDEDGKNLGDSDIPSGSFTTAPGEPEPFKFVYMGDAQNGLDTWGNLVHRAFDSEPDADFYIMAGDLVNRGNERDDWDSFFANADGVYNNRTLVPAIGNHEDQGDKGPWMYLALFDLPDNGPKTIENERGYTFEYSNAIFIVLDSNAPVAAQTAWLEEQLKNATQTWKFVVYHHPAYSSGPGRNNPEIRAEWCPLFDKYHVDLALQGHDHAYLRTWPMNDHKRVETAADGTVYIVSVSGTKFYDQGDFDYTEFGMTKVPTYQVLDIQIDGDTLSYKAYDIDGKERDAFVIEK